MFGRGRNGHQRHGALRIEPEEQVCIFGMPGTGKTTLVKHLLGTEPAHLVYDPNREYEPPLRAYRPNDVESLQELSWVIERYVESGLHRAFYMDEGNIYIPKSGKLGAQLTGLAHLRRHWGVSWGVVARRPVNLHTEVRELANRSFYFRLTGYRDRQTLNDMHSGLGDLVAGLKPFHFVVYDAAGEPWVHPPLPYTEQRTS